MTLKTEAKRDLYNLLYKITRLVSELGILSLCFQLSVRSPDYTAFAWRMGAGGRLDGTLGSTSRWRGSLDLSFMSILLTGTLIWGSPIVSRFCLLGVRRRGPIAQEEKLSLYWPLLHGLHVF